MDNPAPEQQPEGPYAPMAQPPLVFEVFSGLNTQASRPGIADDEMSWCDGFFPFGRNNLRTLPGVGTKIYTAPHNIQIAWFDFANIGNAPYCIAVLSDGSIVQINTNSGVTTSIAPAGTISATDRGSGGITQWGNQFIIIVAKQKNGYFAWDGSVFYQAGTIAPLVQVTNSGLNYTSQPTIILETTGSGVAPTFSATLNNDVIEQINVLTPGSGFGINDFINVCIQGGGSDSCARATATIGPGGGVDNVAVLHPGGGYVVNPAIIFSGGGGTGAKAYANVVPGVAATPTNHIQSITVIDPGSGYTSSPNVTVDTTSGGSGAVLAANIFQGVITAITVTDGGSGYITPPDVTIIGDGTGGKFLAEINSSGQVTQIDVIDGGRGYTKALVHFSGGNNAAEASVDLMPYGIEGTAAEIYQSRVWAANGNKISFTTAESLGDFSASNGGGTIEATDSFLRKKYISLRQTNGFLYLVADSSENYISGVTTSGVPPSTTFNNINADPEIGSSWAGTVTVMSRNVIFANSFGVHVSYGGAVTKISDDLDGIYASVPGFGGFVPSAGKAIIFGKRVWAVLIPVIDSISGNQENKLFLWNGKKWFSSGQDINLVYVQSQEINSVLTLYGTDGTGIYPLFQNPSTSFKKTLQSKLWDKPGGYMLTKTVSRIWGEFYIYDTTNTEIDVSLDNELVSAKTNSVPPTLTNVLVINVLGATVVMVNSLGASVTILGSGTGIVLFQPNAASQQGHLLGFTLSTSCADMAVISMAMDAQIYGYDG